VYTFQTPSETTRLKKIQLSYSGVAPDQHNVFDGRQLGRELIAGAYKLSLSYVGGCPTCADNLFTVIANEAMREIHDTKDAHGKVRGQILTDGIDAEAQHDHCQRHLNDTGHRTQDILKRAQDYSPHDHIADTE
jgi:hypothetical protein